MESKRLIKKVFLLTTLTLFISGCSLFSGGGNSSKYDPFAPEDVVDGIYYTAIEEEGYAVFNGIYDNIAFDKAYQNVKTFEVKSSYKGYPVQVVLQGALSSGDCSSIEEIIIPSSVKVVERGAFGHCYNLKKLVLNEGLEEIGDTAFKPLDHESTVDFTIPSTVKKIGEQGLPRSSQTLTIPSGIEELGNTCLINNAFEEINLPGTLKKMGADVFAYSTAKAIVMSDEITSLPTEAFAYVQEVERIHISNSLKTLPERAFYDVNSDRPSDNNPVIEITGGEAIETIEKEACLTSAIRLFPYSKVLKSIRGDRCMYYVGNRDFPQSLTGINETAFYNHSEEAKDILAKYPTSISYVPDYLFSGCNFANTEITIRIGNRSYIGEGSFSGTNLTEINLFGSNFEIKEQAFYGCKDLTTINYSGTVGIFRNLVKGNQWCYGTQVTCVHCSDGDFEL